VTIVVGTAGHIDHGKTRLLHALTGIDADRLPEEQRRGMTIDVGYAHLALEDGSSIDFVDVPGHDRLVGNMLVGAGEIDAAMLVVAADDGPRAQTHEHLALLDALGISIGIVVITKVDAVGAERIRALRDQVEALLAPTVLTGSPILAASSLTGAGVDEVREALLALRGQVRLPDRPATLAIDRVFSAKGRGVVVTGTLRGGPLTRGEALRLVPGDGRRARIREIQVHGSPIERVEGGGRTALNIAGIEPSELHRGMVLTADPAVTATDRVLVAFDGIVADRAAGRVHAGTAAVEAVVGRAGRDAISLPDGRVAGIVRLAQPIALRAGDRFVLRRGASALPIGGLVLDPLPPRGLSRRRQTPERVGALVDARPGARLDLHGILGRELAGDIAHAAEAVAIAAVDGAATLPAVRTAVALTLRRAATVRRDEALAAADLVIDRVIADGRLTRVGQMLRAPGVAVAAPDLASAAAMDRLEALLSVTMPPTLPDAARAAGCPTAAVHQLERDGRIVVLDDDLAYATSTYRDLVATALELATGEPLTPAMFRDATGTSRKYVMAILEDLDRRAILRRTPAGHVPGAKAPAAVGR
jgi:selenocysteine-specific elongation factor